MDHSTSVNNIVNFHKVSSDLELKKYLLDCNYYLNVNLLYCCSSPSCSFERFKNQHQFLMAAGGLVQNESNSVLMIYKNDIWDLPKGKVDSNESLEAAAQREVREETNVKDLDILPVQYKTYHMYNISHSTALPMMILKETTWFLMQSKMHVKLMPQIEEGIVEVAWVSMQDIYGIRTYDSIRLVLRKLLFNFFDNWGGNKML